MVCVLILIFGQISLQYPQVFIYDKHNGTLCLWNGDETEWTDALSPCPDLSKSNSIIRNIWYAKHPQRNKKNHLNYNTNEKCLMNTRWLLVSAASASTWRRVLSHASGFPLKKTGRLAQWLPQPPHPAPNPQPPSSWHSSGHAHGCC